MILQKLVHEALDNALGNGYFDPGMDLHGLSNDHIAADLQQYDAELENYPVEEIIPHVQSWWHKL